MKVNHGREPGVRSVLQGEGFTGDVLADPVLSGVGSASVNNVLFNPRARTHWHTHSGGQILYVTSGCGRAFSRGRGGFRIMAGDVVWTEPGEEHWHGADEHSYLVHLAISLGDHEWLEPVTDEEYDAIDLRSRQD